MRIYCDLRLTYRKIANSPLVWLTLYADQAQFSIAHQFGFALLYQGVVAVSHYLLEYLQLFQSNEPIAVIADEGAENQVSALHLSDSDSEDGLSSGTASLTSKNWSNAGDSGDQNSLQDSKVLVIYG